MEASRVYCQIFSTLLILEYLVAGLDTFSSRLPDFMENFKDSLLTMARHDDIDYIDLSARNPCYEGNIGFRKSNIPVRNASCNFSDSDTFINCGLSDGDGAVNLTLELFKDCRRVVPQILRETKSLHLQIWAPVLGLIMLVLITALLTYGAKRANKKRESSKSFSVLGKEQKKPNYTTLQTQISSISSTTTTIIIPDTPHHTPISPNLFYNTSDDSAFSSMKTLEATPEDEGSTPGELVTSHDLASASDSSDLKIIYTRSTTSLNEVILLDVDVNNESSTDATLRKVKVVEVQGKEINEMTS